MRQETYGFRRGQEFPSTITDGAVWRVMVDGRGHMFARFEGTGGFRCDRDLRELRDTLRDGYAVEEAGE